MRKKPLIKSLREKKRHVLFKIDFFGPRKEKIRGDLVFKEITNKIRLLFGEFGLAQINPYLSLTKTDKIIVTCKKGEESKLILAALLVREVGGKNVALETISTSGTLNSLKTKIA